MDGRGSVHAPYGAALALGRWAWENRLLIFGRIALNGGDPERISLPSFLAAAYALLVEAYERIGAGGMDLPSAVQTANESIGLAVPVEDGVVVLDSQPTAADNDRAMAELQRMMSGVM